MLIRTAVLRRIQQGEVTLAFRRWRRPTVKAGGTLRTALGELSIGEVAPVSVRSISADEARKAGYDSKAELMRELAKRQGRVYRISLSFAGEDPRIRLRASDEWSHEEYTEIQARLHRIDAASRHGPWTRKVLSLIATHPRVRAADLADKAGYEKAWFKSNVRKLKNMGLTISHEVGYELSPRGAALWARLRAE